MDRVKVEPVMKALLYMDRVKVEPVMWVSTE